MGIETRLLCKSYGSTRVVDQVSLEIASGSLVALLGPSGGGKSTILRMIAGLEQPDSGEVWIEGQRVDQQHTRDRQIGFVFQHYALFRHKTVAENIGFGLEVRGVDTRQRRRRVGELLDLIGLNGFEDRKPDQLSGGQRQRVALARALAPEPRVLLLDEPFGAIDAKIREDLRRWLRRLHDEIHTTSIFVTHDQEEAFAIADRVVVVQGGRVEQAGPPSEILDAPSTEFVARFVGEANVLDATWDGEQAVIGPLRTAIVNAVTAPIGAPLHVVIRLYDLKFWADPAGPATVKRLSPLGDRVRVEATLTDGRSVFAVFPRRSSLLKGLEPGVRIHIEITLARAWPTATPQR